MYRNTQIMYMRRLTTYVDQMNDKKFFQKVLKFFLMVEKYLALNKSLCTEQISEIMEFGTKGFCSQFYQRDKRNRDPSRNILILYYLFHL